MKRLGEEIQVVTYLLLLSISTFFSNKKEILTIRRKLDTICKCANWNFKEVATFQMSYNQKKKKKDCVMAKQWELVRSQASALAPASC